jgi:hypothetical protein
MLLEALAESVQTEATVDSTFWRWTVTGLWGAVELGVSQALKM